MTDVQQIDPVVGNSPPHLSDSWQPLRIVVVGLCFVINMLDGADMLVMSFIAPALSDEWGISMSELGIIFSASLAGMAIGCLFVAPLGDRFGRRTMIIGALSVVTVTMISLGYVTSVLQLMIARLILGIGIGTIGVTMTAIASDYAPAKHSSFAAGFVQAGWPLGSIITALVAASVIGDIGWRPLLMGIGFLSLILLVAVLVILPESLSFLIKKQPKNAKAKIQKIAAKLKITDAELSKMSKEAPAKVSVKALFEGGRGRTSGLLWTAAAFGYFILYFVISWIPKLAVDAGLPLDQAIYAGATYNAGAFIGTALMGWLVIRFRVNRVIATLFFASVVALLVFGGVKLPIIGTLIAAAAIGITVQGGFNGFWVLAAKIYPPEMRGTGIGWALGVGRIGAVLGPWIGGVLLESGMSISNLFSIYALAPIIAAVLCLFINEKKVS